LIIDDLHLSEFGIELGQVSFQAFYQGIFLGREYFPCLTKSLVVIDLWSAALSSSQVTLNPLAVTHTHFSGRIVPQNDNDLKTLGQLFSQFLMGHNMTFDDQRWQRSTTWCRWAYCLVKRCIPDTRVEYHSPWTTTECDQSRST